MDEFQPDPAYGRRAFLLGATAFAVAACTGSDDEAVEPTAGTAASGSETSNGDGGSESAETSEAGNEDAEDADPTTAADPGPEPLTPAMFEALAVCAMAPSSTAGPFPSLELLDRREIHEGYPGHPLRLGVRVVDGGCQPVAGAAVEIWHTDASGDYSSYTDDGSGKDEGAGTTFCRGIQTADDDGILEFLTIYPGWYEGRAVHIHTRVHIDGEPVLTAQLYFDEAYTEAVHATGEYAQFGPPDTPWADDGIIGDPTTDGTGIVLAEAATDIGPGTLGLLNLAVDLA